MNTVTCTNNNNAATSVVSFVFCKGSLSTIGSFTEPWQLSLTVGHVELVPGCFFKTQMHWGSC